ncbi:MAG: hypothetical protein KAI44_01255, partial [Methylococcales bacterium]|nr:hypothetical protein [Methylococcales bacterium]
MKKLISIFILLLATSQVVVAEHLDLDQLLRDVKKTQGAEAKINKAREARFLAEKNKQQQVLQTALSTMAKQQRMSVQLKAHLDSAEEELSQLETELKSRSGELGEL